MKTGGVAAEFGFDVVTNGSELFVGEPSSRSGRGNVHHYMRSADSGEWSLVASWTPPDNAEGRRFGHALALDGDRLVVGAPSQGGFGAIYVYRSSGNGSWDHDATLTVTEEVGDRFGSAVSVSGNRIASGAVGAEAGAGVVYVFELNGGTGTWESAGSISGPTTVQSGFGGTLAFGEDMLVVGAKMEDDFNGAVYVFEPIDGEWSLAQKISKPRGSIPLAFGAALATSGDSIIIGANIYEARGTVYLYDRPEGSGSWQEVRRIGQGEFNENYGRALAFEDPWLVVGGVGFDDFSGRIHVFRREGSVWTRTDSFASSAPDDNFGQHLDIAGGVIVSTTVNGDAGDGAVRIFTLDPETGKLSAPAQMVSPIEGFASVTGARTPCSDGQAAGFACRSVDLMSFLSIEDIGGPGRLNDVWGWTHAGSGREFALVGRNDGTAFVEITSPTNPQYLGLLPTHLQESATRDIKVYGDHAFVVADGAGQHGMQIFDLTKLLEASNGTHAADVRYSDVASVHNVAINEQSGRAFLVGDRSSETGCSGGIHIVDIRNPIAPAFESCARDTQTGTGSGGYTHDVQCILYDGPDTRYTGREICVGSNTTHVSVFDVTRGSQPAVVGRGTYPDVGYIHQGWFTDDRRYFYQNDEADEFAQGRRTRTLIWDMQELTDPVLVSEYEAETVTTDHNLYIMGDIMVQANYGSGMRIVDISDRESPMETGFFDTAPSDYGGAWTAYPYFASGNIVVSSIAEGLFVLRGTGPAATSAESTHELPVATILADVHPNPSVGRISVAVSLQRSDRLSFRVFDLLGRQIVVRDVGTVGPGRHEMDLDLGAVANGLYVLVAETSIRREMQPFIVRR